MCADARPARKPRPTWTVRLGSSLRPRSRTATTLRPHSTYSLPFTASRTLKMLHSKHPVAGPGQGGRHHRGEEPRAGGCVPREKRRGCCCAGLCPGL